MLTSLSKEVGWGQWEDLTKSDGRSCKIDLRPDKYSLEGTRYRTEKEGDDEKGASTCKAGIGRRITVLYVEDKQSKDGGRCILVFCKADFDHEDPHFLLLFDVILFPFVHIYFLIPAKKFTQGYSLRGYLMRVMCCIISRRHMRKQLSQSVPSVCLQHCRRKHSICLVYRRV